MNADTRVGWPRPWPSPKPRHVHAVMLGCGHGARYASPEPRPGEEVVCARCGRSVLVV